MCFQPRVKDLISYHILGKKCLGQFLQILDTFDISNNFMGQIEIFYKHSWNTSSSYQKVIDDTKCCSNDSILLK